MKANEAPNAPAAKAKEFPDQFYFRSHFQDACEPQIAASRIAVIDPKNRALLIERNSGALGPVGSIQKLLAALLIVENGALDKTVVISPEDIPAGAQLPTTANLRPDDTHSRRDLLTAMLVGSANDAANALARDHSGTTAAFVDRMNLRAKKLGMKSSKFFNPTGLPHDQQFSSAQDIATLASTVDEVPALRAIVSLPDHTVRHGDGTTTSLRNTNRLLRTERVCDGMKTGFTRASGRCLVASGSYADLRRIVIVLNSVGDLIWNDARQLMNFCLGMEETANGVAGASG